jgi:hypothetical protein
VPQVTHNLWVTGAQFCDFVSYDDRMPVGLQYFCVRVKREDLDIANYVVEVHKFLAEIDAEYQALLALKAA